MPELLIIIEDIRNVFPQNMERFTRTYYANRFWSFLRLINRSCCHLHWQSRLIFLSNKTPCCLLPQQPNSHSFLAQGSFLLVKYMLSSLQMDWKIWQLPIHLQNPNTIFERGKLKNWVFKSMVSSLMTEVYDYWFDWERDDNFFPTAHEGYSCVNDSRQWVLLSKFLLQLLIYCLALWPRFSKICFSSNRNNEVLCGKRSLIVL